MCSIALLSFSFTATSQTKAPVKTENQENKITFSSEEEKAKKIAAIQQVIDDNKDNPKADLTMYYRELEVYKNAQVIKIENK